MIDSTKASSLGVASDDFNIYTTVCFNSVPVSTKWIRISIYLDLYLNWYTLASQMFRASHYVVYSYTTVNGIESMFNDAFVLQTCECSKFPPRRHHEHHPPEIGGEISLPKSSQQNPLKMTIWSPYWILHSVSQWNLQCCNNFPPPPKQKHTIIHYPHISQA